MPNWPPDPNKRPDNSANQPVPMSPPSQPSGQEWRLLENTLLASVVEQRRARRWSIFFKLLTFGYILLIFLTLGRSCSSSAPTGLDGVDTSKPHLAVVELQGVISSGDVANAYDVNEALTRAFENSNSKAVALDINSPGGSPVQSDEIWQTMMDLRKEYPDKKLYAVIGDMGASGAYYIASAADEIYVNPSSLVGSIGVIMPSYNIKGLMDKVGVEDRTITAGEYKDILSLSRPLTDYEEKHVEKVLDNTHKHFINAVKEGRGDRLKNPEQNKLFSGLFWTGEQSIELGLADKKGSIASLEKQLELDNVINYSPTDPFQLFMDRFAVKLGAGIGSSVSLDVLPQEEGNAQMR
ncbi:MULTISPECIES: signal peptide peptidase SppA [Psychrobacter]|jgi:protease-4|uniref:Protease-4 n=1 Tax=Psychrobacter immobilis TaxID=498 RepID=A0A2V1ZXE1_PSYIM|nr:MULTISPECIES: signal peptide peptidase SppA [Psychrobacter]MDN5562034.1 signal peptide peptidase SppA [Psychrobacter sp.]KRG34979.1 peptidase S49 [Psychrobacter sp. P11F6]MCG3810321.1 signal peptide peptidase SppA [Psychrobacter sp. Ps4]MCG3871615.1 signal peptide peptidase SppA [Psychrobacter sp. Ps7]PWK13327.1 protease-4 [Psychrobacter immobilis]